MVVGDEVGIGRVLGIVEQIAHTRVFLNNGDQLVDLLLAFLLLDLHRLGPGAFELPLIHAVRPFACFTFIGPDSSACCFIGIASTYTLAHKVEAEARPTLITLAPGSCLARLATLHTPVGGTGDLEEPLDVLNIDEAYCLGERSEEHTSELQSQSNIVCRLLIGKKV